MRYSAKKFKPRNFKRKSRSTRYPKRRKTSRARYSFNKTAADARVGSTLTLKRQGPYKRQSYQPRLKASGHRAESLYNFDSSVTGPAVNPVAFIINSYGSTTKLQSGTMGTPSPAALTTFDAYFVSSQNAPYGMTKVFSKACKVKIIAQNDKEVAGKVRITFAKLRKGMIGSLPGQWNSDVNRPIATRHWKVIKSDNFIMEPVTYTDAGVANGITTIEKNYYIPINKWRYTVAGDAATSGGSWQMTTYNPQDAIYLFIDTNDLNPTGSLLKFNVYINDYFSTVGADQT